MSDKIRKGKFLPLAPTKNGMTGVLMEPDGFTLASFREVKEGEPLMGTYVELNRKEGETAFDAEIQDMSGVQTLTDEHKRSWGSTGPFRNGWDRIWGDKNENVGET